MKGAPILTPEKKAEREHLAKQEAARKIRISEAADRRSDRIEKLREEFHARHPDEESPPLPEQPTPFRQS